MNEQLDGGAVQNVERIVLEGQKPQTPLDLGPLGLYTAQKSLNRIKPFHALPESRKFLNLTGLVAYLNANPDGLGFHVQGLGVAPDVKNKGVYLHVTHFNRLVLIGPPESEDRKNPLYAVAESPVSNDFPFDKFMPVEMLVIKLRSLFQPNEDLSQIVEMLQTIDNTESVKQQDDGVAQSISIKKGGSGVLTMLGTNKGAFRVKPFRTFAEIDQPEIDVIFRLKTDTENGASGALFSAGGTGWELTAISRIGDYIKTNGPKSLTVLA